MSSDSSQRRPFESANPADPVSDSGSSQVLDQQAPVSESAAEQSESPVWFQGTQYKPKTKSSLSEKKKVTRRRRKKKKPQSPAPIGVQTEEDESLTWQELVRRWFQSFSAMGYGVSLLFHAVLLIILSLILLSTLSEDEYFSTVVMEEDAEPMEFDVLDTRIDMPAGGDTALEDPVLQTLPNQALEIPQDLLTSQLQSSMEEALSNALGSEKGLGDGLGGTLKFAMPKSGKVVTKGRFTAWTVPEDPKPEEDYKVIIQIRLSKHLKRYPRSDLTGIVVGTDGYKQVIPGAGPRFLPLKNNVTQLVITVPGAFKLVKDRIQIRSRMLKEQQVLQIVF